LPNVTAMIEIEEAVISNNYSVTTQPSYFPLYAGKKRYIRKKKRYISHKMLYNHNQLIHVVGDRIP
jgi:hypothetical protein